MTPVAVLAQGRLVSKPSVLQSVLPVARANTGLFSGGINMEQRKHKIVEYHWHEYADGPYLKCPNCGETYLHHDEVTVSFRSSEDSETGLKTIMSKFGTHVDRNAHEYNPSFRRSGLTIEFWCEICHYESVLSIAQHKGHTEIEFTPVRRLNEKEIDKRGV